MDRGERDAHFRGEVEALADIATIHLSSNNHALLASRLINRDRCLGESRFGPSDRIRLRRPPASLR